MRSYYLVVLLLAGISTLMVEVLGTRLIAPFFGSSMYVWSSLILVTMIALALGNWLGGWLADLRPSPGLLSPIFFLAGISTMLLPLLSEALLPFLLGGSLIPMVLLSALLIFTPPLFLLGMLCPIIVKLLARSPQTWGLAVGSIYAINTVGSIIGALLSGFVLLPLFGVRTLFIITAIPLLLMAVPGWVIAKNTIREGCHL